MHKRNMANIWKKTPLVQAYETNMVHENENNGKEGSRR